MMKWNESCNFDNQLVNCFVNAVSVIFFDADIANVFRI